MSGRIERMRERENAEAKFAYHIRREVGERVLEQMSICIFNSGPAERGLGDVSWTLAYCVANLSKCVESPCAREGAQVMRTIGNLFRSCILVLVLLTDCCEEPWPTYNRCNRTEPPHKMEECLFFFCLIQKLMVQWPRTLPREKNTGFMLPLAFVLSSVSIRTSLIISPNKPLYL